MENRRFDSRASLTPMMRQYIEIKQQYKDCILFFRLGDFYEMFMEDAEKGAKLLEIVLTHRNGTPMCGIPHHSVDQYLARLTACGEKVALCEQVSDPSLPGIVKREVVRVVTPGTTFSENLLDHKSNNYLLALYPDKGVFGLAMVDITTGACSVTQLEGYDQLAMELRRINPQECILPNTASDDSLELLLETFSNTYFYKYPSPPNPYTVLETQFQVASVDSLGIAAWPLAVEATGLLLSYLKETQKTPLHHLKNLRPYSPGENMILDEATLRNLELVRTLHDHQKEGSLLGVLDHTKTAMGGRLLKQWLLRPLTDRKGIEERLKAVTAFTENPMHQQRMGDQISAIVDLERALSRLSLDRGTPRDLVALKISLQRIPELKNQLSSFESGLLADLQKQLKPLPELVELIQRAIVEEPPMNLREGGFIQEGFNSELDELRSLSREGKGFIKHLQQQEIQRTGISSLKVKYNKVFGYYIEISKSNLQHVPEDYIRKQTLVNAERFITPELKTYEEKVLTADEKSKALEYELFKTVREKVMEDIAAIQANAQAIATLDVLLNFAYVAGKNRYARPQFTDESILNIVEGRHPVVESMNLAGDFISNDTLLTTKQQMVLLTGPNMSGKSTLLRQVALITLMAQMGSYVPARSATLGIVDRIFTRVGASDNLTRGQSTFMVEMQEAAHILNNATAKSLIILDEIGRGTSTYDGMSIAWAILEYIHDYIRAKTLFATHYHELIPVAERLEHAENYSVAVHEDEKGVVFLHKIQKGGIDKSYGIEVAKRAGVPQAVIQKAQHILRELEEGVLEKGIEAELKLLKTKDQMDLFHQARQKPVESLRHPALEHLKMLDVNQMTPIQALQALAQLKENAS